MNGRGQLYMNLGITLAFGVYGIVGALYTEIMKPVTDQNPKAIAIDIVSLFAVASSSASCLIVAKNNYEKNK